MARSIDTATIIRNGTGSTIDSDLIGDGVITAAKLSDNSVTAAKLSDNSVTTDKLNIGQLGGRRNLIINGAMQVSQRYGTNRTFVTANLNGYTLDRWNPGQFQQAGHQQVSVTDSSVPTTKAARVTSSSAVESATGTRMAFGQIVEHANCDFVAGKTVTLSLWIRFRNPSITGTDNGFFIELSEYDTVDPDFSITGATRTNSTTISNGSYPTTWTKYTKTITCASTVKNIGARFVFADLFNTSNNEDEWYEVTAVQLELGDTATPFEHRSYGEELALCQRYYEWGMASGSGYAQITSIFDAGSTSNIDFKVSKRVVPTMTNMTLSANQYPNNQNISVPRYEGGYSRTFRYTTENNTTFWNVTTGNGGSTGVAGHQIIWNADAEL